MEPGSAAAIAVTEHTGHFPAAMKALMPGRTAVTIVAQSAGEPPSTFAERVARRVARHDPRQPRSTAVLCCGAQSDDASWNGRARLAASLLSAIDDGGELIISASHHADRQSLPHYLELVDGLRQDPARSAKSVRLRFASVS